LVVKTNNMSSKFSSPFFQKSPLYRAYTSGADAVFAVSDAPHFAKLQNDLLGGVLASDKKDPCQKLEDRYSSGVITKQRYMDGLKNCGKNNNKQFNIDLATMRADDFTTSNTELS
tara:strand:+ start:547 stop:891 length:345 start_codon:yes stop_codon:yes gene_type:complete